MRLPSQTEVCATVSGRIQEQARDWDVVVEHAFETESSAIAFGTRDNLAVVLKVIKRPGDEWLSGEVLRAFNGKGVVRVYEHVPGAVLLERLKPGDSLADMSLEGNDEAATEIFGAVIQRMSAKEIPRASPTVEDWGKAFASYIATGNDSIPGPLVGAAQGVFSALCASQGATRLLHGDLQHYNILFDSNRGWLAIDPKGVAGEIEYEVGAFLRNPIEQPESFLPQAIIERRVRQLSAKLKLDSKRVLAWGFAQAVLSAIWGVEDGFEVNSRNPCLRLADVIQAMMDAKTVPGL